MYFSFFQTMNVCAVLTQGGEEKESLLRVPTAYIFVQIKKQTVAGLCSKGQDRWKKMCKYTSLSEGSKIKKIKDKMVMKTRCL